MKHKIKSFLYHFIAKTLGNLLIFLRPKKAREMSANRITLIYKNKKNMTISEVIMRAALVQKLEDIEDYEEIASINRRFWENNTATELFKETEEGFEKDFLPHCTFIFDLLKQELKNNKTNTFETFVEIGTGNGDVLNWLSTEYPNFKNFIGIDLSEHQIKINKERFHSNKKLKFVSADAIEWVKNHGSSNIIFVTSRGVLEYFLESQLYELLENIKKLEDVYFVAIEPNGGDHDFENNPHSQLYGDEPSFSHNYPKVFKNSGFNLWHFSQKRWSGSTHMQTFIGAKN